MDKCIKDKTIDIIMPGICPDVKFFRLKFGWIGVWF